MGSKVIETQYGYADDIHPDVWYETVEEWIDSASMRRLGILASYKDETGYYLVLKDPGGKLLVRKVFHIDEEGGIDYDLPSPEKEEEIIEIYRKRNPL